MNVPVAPPPLAKARPWAAVAVVVLAALVCGLSSLVLPLGRDHGIGLYIGDVVLHGGAPYQDAWDIKPPGIFYLEALAIGLLGKTAGSPRVFDLLWQTLTAVALFFLGRRWFGRRAGLAAGVLYSPAYFWANDFWHLGNFDAFLALPSVAMMLCVTRRADRRTLVWDVLAGALAAFVFLARFTQGLVLVPALVWIFAAGAQRPYQWAPRLRRLAALTAGFVAGVALFVAHLAATGAVDVFVYTLFEFAPHYAATAVRGGAAAFAGFIARVHADFFLRLALLTVPALLAAVGIVWKHRTAAGAAAIAWVLATLLGIGVMAKFFAYHWLPLYAPLALLAGLSVAWTLDAWRERRRAFALAATVALLIATGTFASRFGPVAWQRTADAASLAVGARTWDSHLAQFDTVPRGGDFSATANYRAAQYLREHTQPGEGVFVWGFEMLIYYLADRRPPTRFCSNFPLSVAWRRADWVDELQQALRHDPPTYVLLVSGDAMPWVTGHGMDSLTVLRRDFRELSDWITREYSVETKIENIYLCRRKNAPSP